MSNSIGDLKNSGLQGNNFPWQLKMLEGLQKIYDEVKKPLTCAEDSITICNTSSIPVTIDCNDRISLCVNGAIVNAANALPVTFPNAVRTPNIISVTGTGFIAPVVYSISFSNVGPDTELITFDTGTTYVALPPGVSVTMDAGGNNTYAANKFGYDVIGTGPILIVYNT